MALNTNYGLRQPAHDEIRRAFGSLAACVRVTGGDMPTILFYLANPDRIAGAPDVPQQPGGWTAALIEASQVETASETWDSLPKPTIIEVAESIGVCRQVARRALVSAGKWPKPKAVTA